MTRFPHCVFDPSPQGTPEWFAVRKGVLTASKFGDWLAEEKECRLNVAELKAELDREGISYTSKMLKHDLLALLPFPPLSYTERRNSALKTAVRKTLGELSNAPVPDEFEVDPDGPPPRNPGLWAIWNGMRLEPEAREVFCEATALEVEQVGFALAHGGGFGCSPDGLIVGKNEGVELKSPLPSTHIGYWEDYTDSHDRPIAIPSEYEAQVHGSMAVTGAEAWWFQSYCPGEPTFRVRIARNELTERYAAGLREFVRELNAAKARQAARWQRELGKEAA